MAVVAVIGQALGAPPSSGADNEEETELERKTWLADDNEVWTGETIGGNPNTAGTSAGHLLDELGVDDVNDIDRWLNG